MPVHAFAAMRADRLDEYVVLARFDQAAQAQAQREQAVAGEAAFKYTFLNPIPDRFQCLGHPAQAPGVSNVVGNEDQIILRHRQRVGTK